MSGDGDGCVGPTNGGGIGVQESTRAVATNPRVGDGGFFLIFFISWLASAMEVPY